MNEIQTRVNHLTDLKKVKRRSLTVTGSMYLFAWLVFAIDMILMYGLDIRPSKEMQPAVMAIVMILFFGTIFARVPAWFALNKNRPKFIAINEYDKKNVKYYNGFNNYSITVWITLFAITPALEIGAFLKILRLSRDLDELYNKGVDYKESDATIEDYKYLFFQKLQFKKIFVPIMTVASVLLLVGLISSAIEFSKRNNADTEQDIQNILLPLSIFFLLMFVFIWIAYAFTNRVFNHKLITIVNLLWSEKKMSQEELIDYIAYRKVEGQNGTKYLWFGNSMYALKYRITAPFSRKEVEKFGEALLETARARALELDNHRSINYKGLKLMKMVILDPFNVVNPAKVVLERKGITGNSRQLTAIFVLNVITYIFIGGAIALVLPPLLDNFSDGIGIGAVASLWAIMLFSCWIRRYETNKKQYKKLDWTDTLRVDAMIVFLTIILSAIFLTILYTQ